MDALELAKKQIDTASTSTPITADNWLTADILGSEHYSRLISENGITDDQTDQSLLVAKSKLIVYELTFIVQKLDPKTVLATPTMGQNQVNVPSYDNIIKFREQYLEQAKQIIESVAKKAGLSKFTGFINL